MLLVFLARQLVAPLICDVLAPPQCRVRHFGLRPARAPGLMQLPKLTAGKRFQSPMPPGSADALLLARLAEREASDKRVTAIVTADAGDARRLQDEMAFFAPALRTALFPDWETLPYDTSRPTRI